MQAQSAYTTTGTGRRGVNAGLTDRSLLAERPYASDGILLAAVDPF